MSSTEKNERGFMSIGMEVIKYTLIATLIVIPFRMFVAQPFIVSGASMVPTFHVNDYLVTDLVTYRLEKPKRGDVIIFRYPLDPSMYFVKRIIGLPGETAIIENGIVTIYTPENESVVITEPYIASENRTHESNITKMGEGEYFVLGDNRSGSSDSRVWGPLQEKFIMGRALFRFYPFDTFTYLPGKHSFETTAQ